MPDLLPESVPHSQPAEQFVQLAEQANVPKSFIEQVFELAGRYGPEILTAMVGVLSIYLISKGSSKYGDVSEAQDEQTNKTIRKEATEKIALGCSGMAAISLVAQSPIFAIPEVANVIGALLPYLEERSQKISDISEQVHAHIAVKALAISLGVYTVFQYADGVMEALPAVGITALTVAFSKHMSDKTYRVLTITGGSALTVGSAYSLVDSIGQGNSVGAIMSGVFLVLNFLFTKSEIKIVRSCI